MTFPSFKSVLCSMVVVLLLSFTGCGGKVYHNQAVDGVETVYSNDDAGHPVWSC